MREALLRRNILIIAIVSGVLAALILLVMKLRFFDTVNADITRSTAAYQTNDTAGKALKANLDAQKIAENNLRFAQQQTNAFRQRFRSLNFNLPADPGDGARIATWRRYLNEYNSDYGVELRRVLLDAADETKVLISTNVKVAAPPQNPEDVVTPPGGFLKPLSDTSVSVSATGPLPNVMRFLERINQSEVLLTTGSTGSVGIKVEAVPPLGVRATFNITPYLVATGPDAQLPAPSAAVPAAGAGAPGGAPGAPPGAPTP